MKKALFLSILFIFSLHANAQEVDLIWQGETYTPPFYKGLSLWTEQSKVTLVAIPQGLSNPSGLTYRWTKNGTVLGNISGIGRNSMSFSEANLGKPQTILIEIFSPEGNPLVENSVELTPTLPESLAYEKNPLYGFMFHHEAGSRYTLKENEISFSAFPYFFGVKSRLDNQLSFEWRTNAGGAESNDTVTYRIPDNAVGSSEVSLHIWNKEKFIQDSKKRFLVEFGEENNL